MSKKQAGQTIVETVFLVGIAFLLLSGLVTSAIFSIKASRYSRNKAIATRIGREQIEAIKAEKQEAGFWDAGSLLIDNSLSCTAVSFPSTNFHCLYRYTDPNYSGEKTQVEVRLITWWDSDDPPSSWWDFGGGGDERKNNVILTTIISNWEQ